MQEMGTAMPILCKICSTSLTPGVWSDKDWDGNRQRVRKQKKKVDSLAPTSNTMTTAACTDVDCLSDTETTPVCKFCKMVGYPCPFEIKPAQCPSHSEPEGWIKEEEKKTKENEVPNDYHPTRPVYYPIFKQDPLPHHTPKEKMALDPNYYPPGYIPEEQEKDDIPLLVNNLVSPPKRTPQKTPQKKRKRKKRFQ